MNDKFSNSFFFLTIFYVGAYGQMMKDPRDGKEYPTVQIGKQVWMAQNLAYKSDSLGLRPTDAEIKNREFRFTSCYQQDNGNCEKFGRLYTWKTAQNVCPSGWHLPTKNEYDALIMSLGDEKKYDKLISVWGGKDLFGGWLYMDEELYIRRFLGLNDDGLFWTSTKTKFDAYILMVNRKKKRVKINDSWKTCGLSVRCVMNR